MLHTAQFALTGAMLLLTPGVTSTPASAASASSVVSARVMNGRVVVAPDEGTSIPEADAMITLAWIPGLSNSRVGDVLNVVALSSATSKKDGTFSLTVPNSAQLDRAAGQNDGWLNFIVGVETSAGDSQALDVAWNSSTNTMTPNLNGGTSANTLRIAFLYNAGGQLVNGNSSPRTEGQLAVTPAASALGCQYIIDETFTKYTSILNTHSDSKSKVTYTYGQTANSDIDAGLKYYNSGWGISGSIHVGNSLTAAQSQTKSGLWNAYVTAQFSYTKGHISDYYGAPTGSPCSTMSSLHVGDQKVNPGQWVGGLSESAGAGSQRELCTTSPRSSHTALLDHPGTFTLNGTTATKISAAVTTPYLTLGARSGFSTTAKMVWTTLSAPGVTLCGQSGYPATGPGIMYVQNR